MPCDTVFSPCASWFADGLRGKDKPFYSDCNHVSFFLDQSGRILGRRTHLNPNGGRTLHDGAYLFPTDGNL